MRTASKVNLDEDGVKSPSLMVCWQWEKPSKKPPVPSFHVFCMGTSCPPHSRFKRMAAGAGTLFEKGPKNRAKICPQIANHMFYMRLVGKNFNVSTTSESNSVGIKATSNVSD